MSGTPYRNGSLRGNVGGDMAEVAAAPASSPERSDLIRYGTPVGRWVIIAAVLGSGIAFLDSTVVNVALPAIREDLGGGLSGLQWTIDAYLLTLGSLIIFAGSLGDMFGRRKIFVAGLASFTVASLLCGIAPSIPMLIGARVVQGIGGALLVPSSLAIISASFHPDDRGQAIGAWSGLSGVSTAVGPFLGGWLVDSVSWRLVFLINLPLAAVTIWLTVRHVPETRNTEAGRQPDFSGAMLVALGLGGAVYALIEGPVRGFTSPSVLVALAIAVLGLILFPLIEKRLEHPMIPLDIFKSKQFTGANLVTFVVYAALGGAMFLLVIHLQESLGYSALEAGAAFFPETLLMLLLSPAAGRLSSRIGPRWPMTFGPIVMAVGLGLMTFIEPGISYFAWVLPSAIVFGLGLSLTVSPLTAAVLASVDDHHAGVGSGINNAVARLAGLIAIAVVPFAAGLSHGAPIASGFGSAMWICAGACFVGGLLAAATIRDSVPLRGIIHPHDSHACQEYAREEEPTGEAAA